MRYKRNEEKSPSTKHGDIVIISSRESKRTTEKITIMLVLEE